MNQQASLMPQIELREDDAALISKLLKIAVDAQSGYETAAGDAKHAEHRNILHQYAQQRQSYAAELEQMLQASGHDIGKIGTLAGALHQGWINLRSVTTQGDKAILQECERADELAIAAYHDVMHKTRNQPLVRILRRQVAGIQEAHTQLATLHRLPQP